MQLEAIDAAAHVRFEDDGSETLGLCLFDETWHQGVVGLVAGRIKDRLHRPVVAFARASEGSLARAKATTGRCSRSLILPATNPTTPWCQVSSNKQSPSVSLPSSSNRT